MARRLVIYKYFGPLQREELFPNIGAAALVILEIVLLFREIQLRLDVGSTYARYRFTS